MFSTILTILAQKNNMTNILAFAGSNSSTSINHQLLEYIKKYYLPEIDLLELRSLNIPMFAIDDEKNSGFPQTIKDLTERISNASVILLSTSEHNGNYTSYFKSTIDWISRYNREVFKDKKIYICGTSPGRGGAQGSIESATKLLTRLGSEVVVTYSLPSFEHVFENGRLLEEHEERLKEFISKI